LFQWFSRQDVLPFNPTADLRLPKAERPLPRDVLTAAEVDAVLDQTDVTTAPGLRDRAALEVLYSTAVRRAELVALDVDDVDYGRGVVRVRRGKGRKDRYVPICERALRWLQKYLDEVRPRLEAASDERDDALLLSRRGRRFTPDHMSATVTRYVLAASLAKKGSAHMFRHTVGTLMLEHGADLRHVQEMLGHVDIRTTQIYTRVAIRELKLVHTATHPGAGMVRKT
jgi:integrase/recombinase XerD